MDVTVLHSDAALLVASWHNVFFGYWYGGASVAGLRILAGHERALHQRLGRQIVVYTIVDPAAMRFDEAARTEATRVAKEMGPKVVAHAQIIDGSGLIAAAARAIVSGVNLLARQPHPVRVFARDDDAVDWAMHFVWPGTAAAPMRTAVAQVRDRFATERAR